MKLMLAPMEGVVDYILRDILTQIGGIDQCVTEFCRVTNHLHSDKIFFEICPELATGSKTPSGVPVYFQFLGGNAQPIAENAAKVAALGAAGIDLNFGCPAKTVNRHDGGAVLLRAPERLHEIVSATRKAVPQKTPVTAKIRLGCDDTSLAIENAQAAESGGAESLVVHCRTKLDGYRPPAYWEWIPRIREAVKIPVVANGEIWNVSDFSRCQDVTSADRYMIGRGALANPFIFSEIKSWAKQPAASIDNKSLNDSLNNSDQDSDLRWQKTLPWLIQFHQRCETEESAQFAVSRTKQWLSQLRRNNSHAQNLFDRAKLLQRSDEIARELSI